MIESFCKILWQFLINLNIFLSYNPVIKLLGIYPSESKAYIHMKTCMRVFVAALFIIAQTRKQPRCPSIAEWMNQLWYSHTIE